MLNDVNVKLIFLIYSLHHRNKRDSETIIRKRHASLGASGYNVISFIKRRYKKGIFLFKYKTFRDRYASKKFLQSFMLKVTKQFEMQYFYLSRYIFFLHIKP